MDGGTAKAGREVSPGRTLEIELKRETLKIEITDLPERNYRKIDGEAFYRVIERAETDLFS
jgi:ribosomal 50S subunit-recycling heat shock protein